MQNEKVAQQLREATRRYREAHPERARNSNIQSCRKARSEKPERNLYYRAKNRSNTKGLPFNITPEDVHIPDCCPVLGIPLIHGQRIVTDNSPTLDRVIPALGYVKGNVVVVSNKANRIKNDANLDELEKVLKFYTNFSALQCANIASTTT